MSLKLVKKDVNAFKTGHCELDFDKMAFIKNI